MSGLDTITSALQLLMPSFAKSNGSIEAKIIDVVGSYADSEAIERENTLTTIQNALATQKVTTVEYYRRKAVAFQLGDELLIDPINQGRYYAQVNPQNQIIAQAYVIGMYPNFTLLVNAIGSDGHLRPLTPDELASFKTYFQAFQPIGLSITINSFEVAKITDPNIAIYVRYGSDAAAVVAQVQQNLIDYERVLRPNNRVTLTEITDVIQRVPAVRAVGFSNIKATETLLNGTTRVAAPDRGVFDLLNGAFTFATTLTTANILTDV